MVKKTLGLVQFKELSLESQLDLLHVHGVYVGKRSVNGQVVLLFQLNHYYVEVYYHQYRKNVDRLVTSDQTDILQPYMDQINVKDISGEENEEC